MPAKLPTNWTWAHFDELFHVESDGGRRLPQSSYKKSGKYPVIDQGENTPSGFTDEELAFEGDLPVFLFGDHTRRFKLVEHPFVVGAQGIKILRPASEVSTQFLRYALDELKIESRGYSRHFQFLRKARLPLAPTREQERIVAKLDALLSRLSVGEAAARRALDRLQRYRATVLDAAVTGELTKAWRKTHQPEETGHQLLQRLLKARRTRWEEAELKRLRAAGKPPKDDKWKLRYREPVTPKPKPSISLPDSWTWATLEQLTTKVGTGATPYRGNPSYWQRGTIPWVTSGAVNAPLIESVTERITQLAVEETNAKMFPKGSLVVALYGEGKTRGMVSELGIDAATNQACAALVFSIETAPIKSYLRLFLEKNYEDSRRLSSGGVQTNLSLQIVKQIQLPLPPLAEQVEINREVERRLLAADRLKEVLHRQLARVRATRQTLLREAFAGKLVPQDPHDEPASVLLERIRAARAAEGEARKRAKTTRAKAQPKKKEESVRMSQPIPTAEDLRTAWQRIKKTHDAKRLFEAAGFTPDQVVQFYELLRAVPEIREAFETASSRKQPSHKPATAHSHPEQNRQGRFRLVKLWLENFKNLKNYEVRFDPGHGLDVVLGWNGTGKSNLFEALVLIFRDLHYWLEKSKWPDEPLAAYKLTYEIEEHLVEVDWNPAKMKRPEVKRAQISRQSNAEPNFTELKREDLPLPRFIFGYYSGPTNRLAEHFLPMKRDYYYRLLNETSDDPEVFAKLFEERRFFCAETHHAKYALLAFSYKEDPKITQFLKERHRILGFESALFVIRKPSWARKGTTAKTFWGAGGLMLQVAEKLRHHAIAPMVLRQTVSDGYRTRSEDHYYFFLPDLKSLHTFAAEYADARSFFFALESTDFSELLHDVRIQVRVKATESSEIPITFRELSEGEQQLLVVLGLMRFTKSRQSFVLLDEPDTHLNPHWGVEYLKDLASVMSDNDDLSPEQQTSQLLMATHDPLVIASLLKEQVHLLKRDRDSLHCYWEQASVNPKGLGFTGILISDMFGFRSDLDEESLGLLDRQVQLAVKTNPLSEDEKKELAGLNKQIDSLGFKTVSSDPYYRAFIEALGHRRDTLALMQKPVQTPSEKERIRQATDAILTELVRKHSLHP